MVELTHDSSLTQQGAFGIIVEVVIIGGRIEIAIYKHSYFRMTTDTGCMSNRQVESMIREIKSERHIQCPAIGSSISNPCLAWEQAITT